ncbi:MAG: phosphate ABC transporter permease PstA [Pseudomonadota bacterium]
MTDIATDAPDLEVHTSGDARARLKKRYRSEARFKLLGLVAVLTSVGFLVILLSNIVTQGIPAFFQHYATFEILLDEGEIDPNGTRDPADIRAANFDRVMRGALGEAIPYAEGRQGRRLRNGLVTSASGILLRDQVLANPDLIGTTISISVPTSDDADLYLKGQVTVRRLIEASGNARPSEVEGDVVVTSDAADFAPIVVAVKAELNRVASQRRSEAAALQRSLARVQADLERIRDAAPDAVGDRRAFLENEIGRLDASETSIRDQISTLQTQADTLEGRANAEGQAETVDPTLPSFLVRINGGIVKVTSVQPTEIAGQALIPLSSTDQAAPNDWSIEVFETPEAARKITDAEIIWIDKLVEQGAIEERVSGPFFTRGASREPEMAGIWGAAVGSFYTLLVTLLLSFPIGVAAAIYLEEFAPKNRLTQVIEVNINNLAAVPSIVFGLLGLAVFLNVFGLPRSAPIAGGMVLALMTLPTIIIASRAALRAVPPSIREAALGMGASRVQTVFHHVLPLAMPGILTGTIIGMAQALGETAPLLMIGMVAFIVDIPTGPLDAATVLPVQIFMWADFPEPAFGQKTAAAIMVLLGFLVVMNALAVVLRKRFERRW